MITHNHLNFPSKNMYKLVLLVLLCFFSWNYSPGPKSGLFRGKPPSTTSSEPEVKVWNLKGSNYSILWWQNSIIKTDFLQSYMSYMEIFIQWSWWLGPTYIRKNTPNNFWFFWKIISATCFQIWWET